MYDAANIRKHWEDRKKSPRFSLQGSDQFLGDYDQHIGNNE